jgi:3-methyladenine DNA glycosylase AlkD
MTAQQILAEIKPLGRENYRNILHKHGILEPLYGVKIEELKKIQKRVKKDHQLALDLYATGVYDAMYLAGLIADESKITRKDLQSWIEAARFSAAGTFIVATVAAESPHGWDLALKWIDSKKDLVAEAGWATLSGWVYVKPDADLDLGALKKLLARVEKNIHQSPNCVRYTMNGFVIAVGCGVASLSELAFAIGERIGKVTVDMGDTACQVPFAPDYIEKVRKRGTIGKKRKSARC